MSKPPVLKPREVVALLEKLGFAELRQRGSHRQYRHPDGRGTTVPFHKGRDISPTLLRQIAKDIGLSIESFLAAESGGQQDNAVPPTVGAQAPPKKPGDDDRD